MKPKAKLKVSKALQAKTTLKKKQTINKRPKAKSVAKLKANLDVTFGRYIKYRDGHMIDGCWQISCVTCHKPFIYRDREGKRYTVIQAGHFMSRGFGATRYNEQNVNGQCAYCNKWLGGDQYKHGLEVDKKYGPGTAARLYDLAHQPNFKFTREWLQEQLDHYTEAIAKYEAMW